MAVQRYMKYQYETSPRKLEPEYKRQQKKDPKKSTAPKNALAAAPDGGVQHQTWKIIDDQQLDHQRSPPDDPDNDLGE